MKISIIVPIYNVEKYLTKCLDSLLAQDLSSADYEIICINDGSPDDCKTILEAYQRQYSNIVVINQENQGVSVARNAGLAIAQGAYILFVDGDDSLYPNVLKALYERATTDDLDLLYLKVEYFDENDAYTGEFKMDHEAIEILDGFHHQRRGFIIGLYRHSLITAIRFEKDIPIGEDALFNIMVHSVAKRCSYITLPSYKYFIRAGSALKSDLRYSEKAFLGYLKTMVVLKDYLNTNKAQFNESQLRYFDRPFYKVSEMALVSNIIPTLSISRLKRLKGLISELQLDYLNPIIAKTVPFYTSHWTFFMGYYFLKKLKNGPAKI